MMVTLLVGRAYRGDGNVEILSLGNGLELIKDLGDAGDVAGLYGLNELMALMEWSYENGYRIDVDIRSAHPYWAFPYNDVV